MRTFLTTAAVIGSAFAIGAPAAGQASPEPKVNQLIVYGDDKCPESTDDTITVCARKDEGERFRIPPNLRQSASPQNEAWNNKVLAYERVGRTGTLSCSPVGPGGWTGCAQRLIDQAYAEKQGSEDVRFGELIQAEREKRLSTIDAESAETQRRVEQLENEVEARQRAQAEGQAAPAPAATPTAGPSGK